MTCLVLASWLAHHSCFCARRFTSLGIFQVTNSTFRLDSSFFLLVNNSWYTFFEVLTSSIHKKLEQAGAGTFENQAPLWITRKWRHRIDRSLSRNKKINSQPSSGRSQKNECYKRLIYKQFVQVSSLCGPQFLRYLPKRFAHLCTVLVHQYGRRNSTKTSGVHFFYKSSFFSLKN